MEINDDSSIEENYNEACKSISDMVDIIKADNIVDLLDDDFNHHLTNKKTIAASQRMKEIESFEEMVYTSSSHTQPLYP